MRKPIALKTKNNLKSQKRTTGGNGEGAEDQFHIPYGCQRSKTPTWDLSLGTLVETSGNQEFSSGEWVCR